MKFAILSVNYKVAEGQYVVVNKEQQHVPESAEPISVVLGARGDDNQILENVPLFSVNPKVLSNITVGRSFQGEVAKQGKWVGNEKTLFKPNYFKDFTPKYEKGTDTWGSDEQPAQEPPVPFER